MFYCTSPHLTLSTIMPRYHRLACAWEEELEGGAGSGDRFSMPPGHQSRHLCKYMYIYSHTIHHLLLPFHQRLRMLRHHENILHRVLSRGLRSTTGRGKRQRW